VQAGDGEVAAAAERGRRGGRDAAGGERAAAARDGASAEVTGAKSGQSGAQSGTGEDGASGERGRGFGTSGFERMMAELDATRGSGRDSGFTRRLGGEAQLTRQLRDAHPEIVKHARLIMRGERGGEIRLHLKPESMGNVRVQLHLQDNHIAGRIIVENSSVRDAFEQTLEDLQRAFRESGIETGELEVSVEQREDGRAEQDASRNRDTQAVQALEESVPLLTEIELDTRLVNLLA
jgi:flagellar hook-length control protein FliK